MTRTIGVEIDEAGGIRSLNPNLKLPKGRAVLVYPDKDGKYPVLLPGNSFEDWFTPEEDEAWAYLQSNVGAEPIMR